MRKQLDNYFEKVVADVYTEYQKRLTKNQSLDFDDLIMMTIQLFQRVPDVFEYYQSKFQYIHVDEYQDTNKAQYMLVKLLGNTFQKSYVCRGFRSIDLSLARSGYCEYSFV